MRNSSMKTKQRTFKLKDYERVEDIQYFNYDKTVCIVRNIDTNVRKIMKIIDLGQTNQVRQNERLNRMLNTNHSNLLKPDYFCFKLDENTKTSTLYLLSPRYPVSLEKIIVYHRSKKKYFARNFMERFIVDMYNLVSKLNDQNIQSKNLKPSNIFYDRDEWYVSEFGIPSCRISKYYSKSYTHVYGKGRSMKYWLDDQFKSDNDLYSLGIILMEMMTLRKVEYINKIVSQYKSQHQEESQEAIRRYGTQMVEFAKCLIFGPKSANIVFKKLKGTSRAQYSSSQRFDFSHLQTNEDRKYDYQVSVPELSDFKQRIKSENYDCQKMFSIFKEYDPDLQFILSELTDLQILAREFGYRNEDNVINFWIYYSTLSQMRYVSLFKDIFPLSQIARIIIMFGIENYKDEKQFFIAQTSGAETWTAQQMVGFFKLCQIDLELDQVTEVIHQLTRKSKDSKESKRSYLTYKDIKLLVGKDGLGQSKLIERKKQKEGGTTSQSASKNHIYQSQLQEMLTLLSKSNDGNLFRFFREYDPKNKWVNDYVIQRVIKQSIRMDETRLKNALQNMWSIAGIIAQNKANYKLKYIVLLKQTKQFQAVDLFKMVLTEMCNFSNFNQVFKEYRVSGRKGWSQESLLKLNEDEMLEFHEREIKQVFRDLDVDGSKSISSQQLMYKLTGLREYNESVYIQMLKQAKEQRKINLVSEFMKSDTNSDLDLDSVKQLVLTFKNIGIQISVEHAQKLYAGYEMQDQFMYIKFLKQFYSLDYLFKESVLFILQEHYKSDFDRLYKIGLEKNKSQKWTVKSVIRVNDELVLGFTEKELEEIWESLDKNADVSLSKSEIAEIFGLKYDKQLQESKYIQNYQDDFQIEDFKRNSKDIPKLSRKQTMERQKTYHQRLEQEIQKNQILYELKQKAKKRSILDFFVEADKDKRFALTYNQLENVLNQLGIMFKTSKHLKECLKDYQFEHKGDKYINYIKIVMLFNTLQQKQSQTKAESLIFIVKSYLKQNGITVEKMLKSSRNNNRLSLDTLEAWTKKNLLSEVFFDDLEMIWNYWGNPKYMETKEFKEIVDNDGKSSNPPYVINVREDDKEGKGKDFKSREAKYQEEYNKAKKLSKFDEEKQRQVWKQKQKQKSRWNESDLESDKQRERKREREKQRQRQEDRQREKEREKQRERRKQKQKERDWQKQKQRQKERKFKSKPKHSDQDQYRNNDEADKYKNDKYNSDKDKYNPDKYNNDKSKNDRYSTDKFNTNKYNSDKNNQSPYDRQKSKNRNVGFKQDDNYNNKNYLAKPPRPGSKPKDKASKFKSQNKIQNSSFFTQLNKYGLGKLQNISKNGYIETKDLKRCLIMHYGLDEEQIEQGIKNIQRNNRVKLKDIELLIQMEAPELEVHSRMEPTSSEFQHSIENNSRNQYQRKYKPNFEVINENIKLLIKAFSYKKDIAELSKWMFKDNEYVSLDTFVEKWKDITHAVTTESLEDIFHSMNPFLKQISLLSFKLSFYDQQSQNNKTCDLPPQIQKQLSSMFAKADTNNNKKIQRNQIPGLLSMIGINFNTKDLDIHFKNMDMDGQNSVDFNQFKFYVEKNIFKYVGNYEEHIDEIKQAFNFSDLFGVGALNIDEFKQTMTRMKISVTNEELVSLFREVGENQRIGINKIMYWLNNVDKLKQQRSRMVLYKIRFGKKLTLKDIKSLFSKLSAAYTLSYSANVMKNRQILPSSAVKPKLDQSKLFFKDYYYTNISKLQPNTPCLQRIQKLNQLSLMIRLDEATGIPIPLQNTINRNNIVRRYISISFFDMNQQSIKDSICEFDAVWDADNSDIWKFDDSLGFQKDILVKIGDYNHEKFDEMLVMFEFNVTYLENNNPVEISCGSASIAIKQISRLAAVTDKKLEIIGGIPSKKKYFKKQDINIKRSTWKKMFTIGQVESVLKVEIIPSFKFKDRLKYIDILPIRLICSSSCIDLYYCFRQYFAFNSVENSSILPLFMNQNRVQTFLHSIDCRNIFLQLVPFWNKVIQSKYSGDIRNLKKWLESTLDEIYILFMNKDFNFTPSHPAYSTIGDRTLHTLRTKLMKQTLQNVVNQMKGQQKKHRIQANIFKPLRIEKQEQPKQDNILRSLKNKNK